MKYVSFISIAAILYIGTAVWAEDPDYGNTPETAQIINADSTVYYGTLDTSEDADWFYFEKSANSRYRFFFNNGDYNWKYINIYQKNEFGDLVVQWTISAYSGYGNLTATLFFEPQYDCYMKVYSDTGNYSLRVDYLDTTPPDYYSNSCEDATPLSVDTQVTGTLDHTDPEAFDTDWFVFDTQPMHKYIVSINHAQNSDAYFNLYTDSCGSFITGSYSSYTLVSWAGESYKVQIAGDLNGIGHYYNLTVTDLGIQADDYGNTTALAQPIAADGQNIYGSINYSADYNSDQDWFVFSPAQYGRYRIIFSNADYNWKYLSVYQEDEFGNLFDQYTISAYLSYGNSSATLFFEPNSNCYIKISNDIGDYSFRIEYLDTTTTDSYSDNCNDATPIYADNSPTIGTLDHTNPVMFDTDWFIFATLPLHKYQITLTKADNSDAYFNLYTDSCGTHITGSYTTYTLVSWLGENYKLQITGNSNLLSQYYTIQITDLGVQNDDWPNIYSLASEIDKDGSWTGGIIDYIADYHSDEDWMKFTAPISGDYTFQLNNLDYNWKNMYIYSANQMNEPVYVNAISAYQSYGTANIVQTLDQGLHYIKIDGNDGIYELSVTSPEPRCGDLEHPYPIGDVTQDCYVNLDDVAAMAANWLECSNPNPPCEPAPQ